MPITITGTWTDLSSVFDAAKSKEVGNEPRIHGADSGVGPGGTGINLEVLKTRDGVELPELTAFIQAFSTANGLFYWQGFVLLEQVMKAMHGNQRTEVLLGDALSANRLLSA